MTFNGHQIGDRFLQFAPDRGILSEVENTIQTVGTSDGDRFMRGRIKSRVLAVQYDVMAISQREFERMMAPLLYTTEPAKLSFSDRADEYWLAKVDGKIDLTRAYFLGSGTINFIVPDGVAHSNDLTMVTGQSGTDIAVTNAGTAPSAPILTATMSGDNGLVGWTNDQGGALQFGVAGEVDGQTLQKSERVLAVGYASEPAGVIYNLAATNYPNFNGDPATPNQQKGRIDYATDQMGGDAAIPYFTNTAADSWAGPALYLPIAPNSNGSATGNLSSRTRFYFDTTVRRLGRLETTLQDGDAVAYQFVMRDSTDAKEQFICELYVRDHKFAEYNLSRKELGNSGYKEVSISKMGNVVKFQFGHVNAPGKGAQLKPIIKAITLDDVDGLPVDGYSVWFERFADKEHVIMSVTESLFDWLNVDYWSDLPNRFSTGDVVTADVAAKKVYVNGIEDPTLQIVGEGWDSFVLPTGDMTIMPVQSSWADPFAATIEYRKAWL